MTRIDLQTLRDLLLRRLQIIADGDLREHHPDRQLALLRELSESIMAFQQQHVGSLPPRLRHFLENASFEKAREWVDAELARSES